MPDAEVSTHVDAPAEAVFALVADLSRMGEWSPETTRIELKGGATAPAVGVAWKGHNEKDGKRWSTDAKVVAYTPGSELAFDVHVGPIKVARWAYLVTPDADGSGCTLSESFTDQRGWLAKKIGAMTTKVTDRPAHNRKGMAETIARIRSAAETLARP